MPRKGRFSQADYAKAKKELGYTGKLTRNQAQKVFKRAIQIGKGETRKTYKAPKSKKVVGRKPSMAKKKSRRRRSFTIPLAPTLGIAAGLIEPVKLLTEGKTQDAFDVAVWKYTGFWKDGRFEFKGLVKGWGPILVGTALHWLASRMGVNRILGRAGVPLLRV